MRFYKRLIANRTGEQRRPTLMWRNRETVRPTALKVRFRDKVEVRQHEELADSVENDPSRKQGVHCNNRRTCPVFSRKSVEKFLSRNLQAELHPVWVIPSLIDARQEIDMPPVAFPA